MLIILKNKTLINVFCNIKIISHDMIKITINNGN